MTLFSPFFLLAGLALAGIPILIHILNRRRYREVQWAAMDFLLRAMKKNRKRLRFEQWLLLAVRCLLLALLGLALARPLGCSPAGSGLSAFARPAGLHVLVVDDSYSMAYEADRPAALTHLDQAKVIGKSLLDRLTPGQDAVAIVTASSPARTLFAASYDLAAARNILASIEQTAATTDLAGALRIANQLATEAAAQPTRHLNILSDGTRSSLLTSGAPSASPVASLDKLSSPAAPDSDLKSLARQASTTAFTRVTYHHLGLASQSHVAVTDIAPGSSLVTARQPQDLRATLRGFGDGDLSRTLQWRLDETILPGGTETKPSESADPITLPQVKFGRSGPRVVTTTLLGSDRLRLDTTRRRVVDVADRVRVLLVEGERGGSGTLGSSGAFLRLALAPPAPAGANSPQAPGTSNSPLEPDVISDLELQNRILADYRVVILAAVPQVPESIAAQLKSFVEAGGSLIIFTGEGISPESYNTALLPKGLLPGPIIKRITTDSGSAGAAASGAAGKPYTFDFSPAANLHPMLQVFRGEPRTGLDTAEVFTYWQTEPGPTVERVLDFTNPNASTTPAPPKRDPAITSQALGQGRVVFVATSAGADGWTTLPAKPVFVTLVQEMVASTLSARDAWMNTLVGERLTLPASLKLTSQPTLTDAAGKLVPLTTQTLPNGTTIYRSDPLTRPGLYVLTGPVNPTTGQPTSLPIVTNPDAASEADIRTLPDPAVLKALGDANIQITHADVPDSGGLSESSSADYAWPVMLLVLVLVAGESLLALRFGHRAK